MFGLLMTANEMSKEAKSTVKGPEYAELETPDGTRIKCRGSDVEYKNGEAMVRNTTTSQKTSKSETFVTSEEMNRHNDEFFSKITKATVHTEGGARTHHVGGIK